MIKRSTILWCLLVLGLSVGDYTIKYRAQAMVEQLEDLNNTIFNDHVAIRVLEAEWAYLNDPGRLAVLAKDHLDLHLSSPSAMLSLADAPPQLAATVRNAPYPLPKPVVFTGETGLKITAPASKR